MSGAQAVLTVENPDAETDRTLVIFRDSYGSSLAPLLLDGYAKIILADVRYVTTAYLGQFVDFSDVDDVLLLYSTTVVNSAGHSALRAAPHNLTRAFGQRFCLIRKL